MKKKKKLHGRCILCKFKFGIFFSKTNILKTMANCKNSIIIINEISPSLSLCVCVCVCVCVCIYIYKIKTKKKNLFF